MARVAPLITLAELKAKVAEAAIKAGKKGGLYDEDLADPWESAFSFLWFENAQIRDDLNKIDFDFENYWMPNEREIGDDDRILGFHTLSNGLPFVGCWAGGDWEIQVYFILYWDGKKVRGYVPEQGNTFNPKYRTAYGSEENADNYDEQTYVAEMTAKFGPNYEDNLSDLIKPDQDAYLNDIQSRIQLI